MVRSEDNNVIEFFLSGAVIWSIVALLAVLGAVNIVAPEQMLNAYFHWNYPRCDRRVSGILEMLAALLISIEPLRIWGISFAVMIVFGGIIMLLCSRKYAHALGGMLVLILVSTMLLSLSVRISA
jgi:hypothetical protein